MRFLLVEDWRSHIYAEPFLRHLRELGHDVHAFREVDFYRPRGTSILPRLSTRCVDAQRKLRLGPCTVRLNMALLSTARRLRPDVVFVFRGDHVWPSTVRRLRSSASLVIGWQNDNPYSDRYPWYVWRHFRGAARHYDRLYAYRLSNADDFRRSGCHSVGLLRSFYIAELNYRIRPVTDLRFSSDVTFIGHWEHDGREDYIAPLLSQRDFKFRLWGTLWERSGIADLIRTTQGGDPRPLLKEDYNLAQNSAKISLVFLSKLNQDTYTRRCFEIPACGTFMLSEYSDDLASMFEPGKEAEYFQSPEELLDKARHYLRNEAARERIAAAGYARVHRDRHEAGDRARAVAKDCLDLLT